MDKEFCSELRKAASRKELKLVENSMTGLRAGNKSIEIATIDGVADIPATVYHRSVDIGLINYRSKGGELDSGVYMLRLTAIDEIHERGCHPAIVEVVDTNGKTASRQRIDLDVFATAVPVDRTFDQAVFSLESRFSESMSNGFDPSQIVIVFWCSNGTHAIFRI